MIFIIFIILISIVAFIALVAWMIAWSTHMDMCKGENCPYGWGNFKKFLQQFSEYDNWRVDHWKGSFHDNRIRFPAQYIIHADIIKFDGKCMILDPISYLRFKIWSNKKWKEMKGIDKKVVW